MKKFLRIALAAVTVLFFVGTFVFLYLNSRSKTDVFEIVSPSENDVRRTAVLTGKIEPRDEIDIKPQVSGIISEIKVRAGDMVNKGDVIAVIKVVPDASQLSSVQNRVEVAQNNLDDARRKYERNVKLFDKKVIAREELETSELAYKQAQSELKGAQDALRVVREGVSDFNAAEGSTHVRATISGLVLDVPVKVGASVIQSNTFNDGTTIATVADMSDLIFHGNVDETEVADLRVGMTADIAIGAAPGLAPVAVIEYISPMGKDASGANTFEVKASLGQLPENHGLRAGYSANATVVLNEAKKAMTVPEAIVEFSADSAFVYELTDSVEGQKYERRHIETGISDGINIQVKKGISKKSRLRGMQKN